MPLPAADVLRHPSRLAALRATGLLDAPPQDALDRLTRLASRLVGVPIALASLVDADRHVFASEFGLGEPLRTTRKMPLSHSFCQHVVATRKPLVVEDAHAHPLVFDNLAIPDLGVIAYAGMPLTSEDGEVLGSFCAVDTAPRTWSQDQLDTLEDLAHAASAEMQLRAASRLLSQRQTFLADLLDHTSELICATDERATSPTATMRCWRRQRTMPRRWGGCASWTSWPLNAGPSSWWPRSAHDPARHSGTQYHQDHEGRPAPLCARPRDARVQ